MSAISRRRLLGLGATAGLAGALVGCTGGATPGGATGTAGAGSGSAKLTVQIWDSVQRNGVQAAIDAFTAQNAATQVTLDLLPEDQYYQALDSSLAAGQGPDVVWQSSKAIEYVQGGVIEALDERIAAAGIDLSKYAPEITKLYNFDGRQYGIPKDMDAWVMIYNRATFDQHGVPAPTADWTWDDMVRTGHALLDKSGDRGNIIGYNLGLSFGCADSVYQNGGRFVSEDGKKAQMNTAESIAGFTRILELMDAGLVPNPAQRSDFNALNALTSGHLPIAMIPSWQISAVADAVTDALPLAAVRLPSTNGDFACNTNGLSYMVNANSKAKDEAFNLLAALTSLEGARLHAANGAGLPALPEAQDAWFEANKAVAGIDAVRDASQNVYLRPTTAHPKARPGFTESSTNILPRLWSKDLSVPDALGQMNDIVQRALDS